MAKLSIRDLDVNGVEVLVRADFNVPLKDGAITDDTRIVGALPTIKTLLEGGAKLVLTSHMGRPKGEKNLEFSLAPVAARLSELLGKEVKFASDCIGDEVASLRAGLASGEVALLENVRFYKEETDNDADFAKQLAGEAKYFVQDAFGTVHRAHASTEGASKHVEATAMGLLVEKELEYLVDGLEAPAKPFVVIIGGAKVGDKISVIKNLMKKADAFIIGGAMAYTFRMAQGYNIGDSLVQPDKQDLAMELVKEAEEKGIGFYLPSDNLITQEFKNDAETKTIEPFADGGEIPAGWEGIDIGPKAITEINEILDGAGTVLWNGPMGVFELDAFCEGTKAVAEKLATIDGKVIVGGGDSVTAANKFGVGEKLDFLSTGGGSSLELLEGKPLPGVECISEA